MALSRVHTSAKAQQSALDSSIPATTKGHYVALKKNLKLRIQNYIYSHTHIYTYVIYLLSLFSHDNKEFVIQLV